MALLRTLSNSSGVVLSIRLLTHIRRVLCAHTFPSPKLFTVKMSTTAQPSYYISPSDGTI